MTVYSAGELDADGRLMRGFADTGEIGTALAAVPGVVEAAPVVRGQVMVSDGEENSGAEVYGMRPEDFATIPAMHEGGDDLGEIGDFPNGLALGSGVARELGVTVGDRVRLISPNGVKSALGSTPRVNAYDVVYVFNTGSPDIDRTRAYLPLSEAQAFFNAEGRLDEFQVMVEHPEEIDSYGPALMAAGGPEAMLWSWKDSSGAFLRALTVEDNMMFILMSFLVLIASMNIISGLVMLVKNKGRDIGILRTMGLTEGSVLRVFFLCGAFTGVAGTLLGVAIGCLFAVYFTPIFDFINWLAGGGVWDPTVRPIYHLSAKLQAGDVLSAVVLSLVLSFVVTLLPARRAARMNPVEALRYE